MRFVYLFKIYSNRIVKVKSAFVRRSGGDAAINNSPHKPLPRKHRGTVPVLPSLVQAGRESSCGTILFLVDITCAKG